MFGVIIIITIFIITIIWSQDIDFGVFNYEGSRLTGMNRYRTGKLEQEISYVYDEKGYLVERLLTVPARFVAATLQVILAPN